jgi:hypothetical protein
MDFLGGDEVQYMYIDDDSLPSMGESFIWEPTQILSQTDMDAIDTTAPPGTLVGYTDMDPPLSGLFGKFRKSSDCSCYSSDGQSYSGETYKWLPPTIHVTLKFSDKIKLNDKASYALRPTYQHELQHVIIRRDSLEAFKTEMQKYENVCVRKECAKYLRNSFYARIAQYEADVRQKDSSIHVEDYPISEKETWKKQKDEWSRLANEYRLEAENAYEEFKKCMGVE